MADRPPLRAAASLLALVLAAGCSGGGGGDHDTAQTNTTAPVASTALDVTPCFNQMVAGRTVRSLVVPDVLTLDMSQAGGFPNGRKLTDPVIDLELAALFLDLRKHPVDTLARIPLNPSGNDEPYPDGFPYLAPAHGGVPAAAGGAGFAFRTDPASAYTRVDRMGEPAVATALVRTAQKTAFNDGSPADDAGGRWLPEFTADLTELGEALHDDLTGFGLTTCAVPEGG